MVGKPHEGRERALTRAEMRRRGKLKAQAASAKLRAENERLRSRLIDAGIDVNFSTESGE